MRIMIKSDNDWYEVIRYVHNKRINSHIYPSTYSAPELMVYLNMMGFGGQPLVLGPTVDAYVKYD